MDLTNSIKKHYQIAWGAFSEHLFDRGPTHELPPSFSVLKFQPKKERKMWIYATCGMSGEVDKQGLELFILTPSENDLMIELLTVITHYHYNEKNLGVGHTVNFGYPWYRFSPCDHGLLSLPYLYGTDFEWMKTSSRLIRFLWVIPITKEEVECKKVKGLEYLESLFESSSFNYLDPYRESVV